jgi:hypothetical protein
MDERDSPLNEPRLASDRQDARSAIGSPFVRVLRLLPRDDWLVAGWVLATSVLLFIFGAKSYQVLEDKRIAGFSGWLELWSRWDADQYLRLAEFGYTTSSLWDLLLILMVIMSSPD